MPTPLPASRLGGLLLLLAAFDGASAQSNLDSRITQVTVYPGSATIERVAHVSAGARTLSFACLPAGLDVHSLQVTADAPVRIGETSVLTESRALSGRCSGSALDGRIRELEDQKDALQAEAEALGLVTGYLKAATGGNDDGAVKRGAVVDAKTLAGVADALRRTGQDALLKQRQLAHRETDLNHQLEPLLAERQRQQGSGGSVVAVRVTLAATGDADVRLRYQVNGPGWTPSYRALLDTTTRRLRIERQALVAQASGEDWRGVKLVLSTGQPRRETAGRLPTPWRLGLEPPPQAARSAAAPAGFAMSDRVPIAPAPAMALAKAAIAEPLFDVSAFQTGFATEFVVPQAIDVPSGGEPSR